MSIGPIYKSFVFAGYSFDASTKSLVLRYGFDDQVAFEEKYHFDFNIVNYDARILDRAIQDLFFMAGVSYYKAYRTENIRIDQGQLDRNAAQFFSNTYQKGLGEYFYVNRLDPKTEIPFLPNSNNTLPVNTVEPSTGLLVGIGGGKDSLVSVEILKEAEKIATWSLGHRQQLKPLIKKIGLPHFWVDREIDPLLIELNNKDALNGHIPISAILGCVSTVVAVLSGYRDSIVSNENSANEATLIYDGIAINHQYSKSLEYEKSYQEHLNKTFGDSKRYYSFLRPYSEVKIAEIFSRIGFEKYKNEFSSCNRAFVQSSIKMSWCGKCSKCAFTFLALSPFVDRIELEKLFNKNLLLDPTLVITYQNLLGISGNKPLDCVGEIKESREAMSLVQKDYSGINYTFDLPKDYSYKHLAAHSMPEEIYHYLDSQD